MDKKTLKETIGNNVRELRTAAGIGSAEDLALLMNEHLPNDDKVSKQAVLRIERGATSLSFAEAFALSKAINAPLEKLFNPNEPGLSGVNITSDDSGLTLQIADDIKGDAPQEIVAQFENAVLICKVERVITI